MNQIDGLQEEVMKLSRSVENFVLQVGQVGWHGDGGIFVKRWGGMTFLYQGLLDFSDTIAENRGKLDDSRGDSSLHFDMNLVMRQIKDGGFVA